MYTPRPSLLGLLALVACTAVPLAAQNMSNDKAMTDKAMAHDKMMAPTGTFTGSAGHSVSGTYALTGTGKERRLTLSSNFKMEDAKDVRVVLSKDPMAKGSGNLDLGKVKASGAQEFKIPESADMGAYTTVVLWSKKDGSVVGQASMGGAMDKGAMMDKDKAMMDGKMAKDTGMMKSMAKDTGMMKSMAKDTGMMKKP